MKNRNMLPDVWSGSNWSPLREMSLLQRKIDHMFSEMMEPFSMGREFLRPSYQELEFSPACDIQETDSHYLLSFDLPGVAKDQVKIELRGNQLVISGERKDEKTQKEGAVRSQERYYGAFERVFTLPLSAEAEKIEASYENGVLQVAVPKSEAAKPKSIQIKSEKGGIFSKLLGHEKKIEKAA